jgi:hypothetical protein
MHMGRVGRVLVLRSTCALHLTKGAMAGKLLKIYACGARGRSVAIALISTPYSVNLGAAASSDKQPSCASSSALPLSPAGSTDLHRGSGSDSSAGFRVH